VLSGGIWRLTERSHLCDASFIITGQAGRMATLAVLWHGPTYPLVQTSSYFVSIATTLADVQACQRLRYDVFNKELGEGLESSHSVGLDRDKFDVICDHLMVREALTGEVVGTYRMQTGYRAKGNAGYYSEEFFDFSPYEKLRGQLLELGRACVHRNHRDSTVLLLLWKGILRYAKATGAQYLIGCSSLTSQEPAEGYELYCSLRESFLAPTHLRTVAQPAHSLPEPEGELVRMKTPRLLQTYLDLSAKICGPPAIDRAFKTIDFLTLLDLNDIPVSLRRHLLSPRS
jgi:putative hemolysin